MDFDLITLITIAVVTFLIIYVLAYKAKKEIKLIIYIAGLTVCLYSGLGISFENVTDYYVFYYYTFLVCLLACIRISASQRIVIKVGSNRIGGNNRETSSHLDYYLDKGKKVIGILAIVFLASSFIPLIYPTFRPLDMFNFSAFTSVGIHARRVERSLNIIVKLCDSINTVTLPFFLVHLYNLVEKKKGIIGVLLIIFWYLTEFGQFNYLGRYQLVVMLGFLFVYVIIVRKGEFKLSLSILVIIIVVVLFSLPLLVSFTDIRLGRTTDSMSIMNSVLELFNSECDYPKYYDLCASNAGIISSIDFILWIICLPIPSVIWSSKPAVYISQTFTELALGRTSITASGYYNVLPSILGESFLIFGKAFFFLEAIIIGVLIGLYFRFFLKSKKLSVLTAYMTILIATLGRGGAQSYIPTLISGTFFLLLFVVIVKRISNSRKSKNLV